jgi:hypothetical protein
VGRQDHPASLPSRRPHPGQHTRRPRPGCQETEVFTMTDLGVHDGPIRAFTMRRSRRSRWTDPRVHDAPKPAAGRMVLAEPFRRRLSAASSKFQGAISHLCAPHRVDGDAGQGDRAAREVIFSRAMGSPAPGLPNSDHSRPRTWAGRRPAQPLLNARSRSSRRPRTFPPPVRKLPRRGRLYQFGTNLWPLLSS